MIHVKRADVSGISEADQDKAALLQPESEGLWASCIRCLRYLTITFNERTLVSSPGIKNSKPILDSRHVPCSRSERSRAT